MSNLKEALKAKQGPREIPKDAVDTVDAGPAQEEFQGPFRDGPELHPPTDLERISMRVRGIDVECIVGGCLMRVSFRDGTNPADVPGMLRTFDPAAKVRDEWPMRGGGPKEILSAGLFQIAVDATREFKKITLTVMPADGDAVTFEVRKNQKEFVEKLLGMECLTEGNAAKVKKAWDENAICTVLLRDPSEALTVKYVKSFDGKSFYYEDMEKAHQDGAKDAKE